MKIWTPKEGDIYIIDKILIGMYNSIVIDKVVGFVVPRILSHLNYNYGSLFSFNLEGLSETLYCKAENFQDFKEAIDPQTANVTNKTMREIKLENALKKIRDWDIPDRYDGEKGYIMNLAREALKVNL